MRGDVGDGVVLPLRRVGLTSSTGKTVISFRCDNSVKKLRHSSTSTNVTGFLLCPRADIHKL